MADGFDLIKSKYQRFVSDVTGVKTKKAMAAILSTGLAYSKTKTPIDTATLVNSGDFTIKGNEGIAFYSQGFSKKTGFNYAYHLHETKGWTPGKNKRAEPRFLEWGFTNSSFKSDAIAIMKVAYKL